MTQRTRTEHSSECKGIYCTLKESNSSSHGYSKYTSSGKSDKTKEGRSNAKACFHKGSQSNGSNSETDRELSPLRREKRRDGLVQILIRRNEG